MVEPRNGSADLDHMAAAQVDTLRVGEFAWSRFEPKQGVIDPGPPLVPPEGVEVCQRRSENRRLVFRLNHRAMEVERPWPGTWNNLAGQHQGEKSITIAGRGVAVIEVIDELAVTRRTIGAMDTRPTFFKMPDGCPALQLR